MPVLFDVRSSVNSYSVSVRPDALTENVPYMREGISISDMYFAEQLRLSGTAVVALEANEISKSLETVGKVIAQMRQMGATRDTHLWAVGGGTIQDVACFVASIYMRGIKWTYLPTTLLGMVDSCIGGKSSINVNNYKNVVGTFYPPQAVFIDPLLIHSLSDEQLVAGLIEAAKICYCRGPDVFNTYLSLSPQVVTTPDQLIPIIILSLRAKRWFIEIDEHDRAERLLLNLGHTFGHALEGASNYRLCHGVAVGVGVLCALSLSCELLQEAPGGAAPSLELHIHSVLNFAQDLRAILLSIDLVNAVHRFKSDKKHESASYRCITFDASGKPQIQRLAKTDDSDLAIARAFSCAIESF